MHYFARQSEGASISENVRPSGTGMQGTGATGGVEAVGNREAADIAGARGTGQSPNARATARGWSGR